MPSESDIHDLLARFGPQIINVLDSVGYWDIEGEYNPSELITEIKQQPEYKRYVTASKEKNSRVWDLVKVLFVPIAIKAGIAQIQKDYKPQIARQAARDELKTVKPSRPTAQDYQAQYIKERGGEWITGVTKADGNLLARFVWKNAGEHERPLAKSILKNERSLAYLVDNSEVRLRAIKRTEVGRATRYGAWQYATDWGAKTKTWHTAGDHRVRPSHSTLDGSEIPIGEEFPHEGMFPGEQSINCRCFLTYGF